MRVIKRGEFILREWGYKIVNSWRRERLKEKKGVLKGVRVIRKGGTRRSESTRRCEKRREILFYEIIERSKENDFNWLGIELQRVDEDCYEL